MHSPKQDPISDMDSIQSIDVSSSDALCLLSFQLTLICEWVCGRKEAICYTKSSFAIWHKHKSYLHKGKNII